MVNHELLINSNWRYCNVKNGDKTPIDYNWQNTPRTLEQIHTDNIGLILGKHSNGVCAIDFDGIEAIDHWYNTFDIDITNVDTVMYTSGKEYRFQALFNVDKQYWDVLKRKVVNKLEFRWTNNQSVLPPSKLNDGRQYTWIKSPSKYTVQQLPEQVLVYWLNLIYDDIKEVDVVNTYANKDVVQYDEQLIDMLLTRIQSKVGNLHGDYDVWRTIAWAVCSQLGTTNAKYLMMKHWPTKTKKESKTLNSWRNTVKGPGIGTLIKMSGITKREIDLYEIYIKMKKIDK